MQPPKPVFVAQMEQTNVTQSEKSLSWAKLARDSLRNRYSGVKSRTRGSGPGKHFPGQVAKWFLEIGCGQNLWQSFHRWTDFSITRWLSLRISQPELNGMHMDRVLILKCKIQFYAKFQVAVLLTPLIALVNGMNFRKNEGGTSFTSKPRERSNRHWIVQILPRTKPNPPTIVPPESRKCRPESGCSFQ